MLSDARRATRAGADGRLLLLEEQDRERWDRAAIAEGTGLVTEALRGGRPGRFTLQAAIAAVHAEAPSYAETDWPQLLRLYGELLNAWPTPVVALNRIVPLAMTAGPDSALAEIEGSSGTAGWRVPLPARGQGRPAPPPGPLARRGGPVPDRAGLTDNAAERAFLAGRIDEVSARASGLG